MIPPNAYRLDGFFMAFVAFTYDLMNGSETWSSMWCSLHISLDVDRHWMDKRSLCSDYSWGDRIRLLLFQISAVLVGFRREQRYFGFFFFFYLSFFTWNSFGSTKKLGPKIFFIVQGWFCRLAPTHILFGYGFLLEEKLLSRQANVLSWNVLNSAWFAIWDLSELILVPFWLCMVHDSIFCFRFSLFRSKRLSDSGALEKASIL